MAVLTEIPPEILKSRHRLSSQQVSFIFGKEALEESLEEKADLLAKAGEFIKVTDLLQSKGIGFIPLKGPLLSFKLYGDATVRRYGDIDLLVKPEEVEHARECLLAAGYSEDMISWPSTASGKKKALKYWHHILFKSSDGEVIIELHWRLLNSQWLNFRDDALLTRGNLEQLEFQGRRYMVLKPEAELLYLVIHGCAHRWGMLKWLVDIQRYIETADIEREQFCTLTKQFGCGRMVALCNSMLSNYYPGNPLLPCGTRLPGYLARAAERTIAKRTYQGPENISDILRLLPYSLIVYPGIMYKLRLLSLIAGSSLFNGRLKRMLD